ncbi:hypothetical protein TUM20984_24560 [Mycobacterium antarcticum]|nr:hypothetical protein TUM20984_24560 [Mycolicibacterium sp. TUM20984]
MQSAIPAAVVGPLDLDFESMDVPTEPGLHLNVYTAPAGGPAFDNLAVLASWASQETSATELHATHG